MKLLPLHFYRIKRNKERVFTDLYDFTGIHFTMTRRSYIHMPIVKLNDAIKFCVHNFIKESKNIYEVYRHTVDDFAFHIDTLEDVDNKKIYPPLSVYLYMKEHSLSELYGFTTNKKISDYQKGK